MPTAVNVGGTWRWSIPWVNVGGTWHQTSAPSVNVGGTFHICHQFLGFFTASQSGSLVGYVTPFSTFIATQGVLPPSLSSFSNINTINGTTLQLSAHFPSDPGESELLYGAIYDGSHTRLFDFNVGSSGYTGYTWTSASTSARWTWNCSSFMSQGQNYYVGLNFKYV